MAKAKDTKGTADAAVTVPKVAGKSRRSAHTGRLTNLDVTRATKRGMLGDGNGLWLQVAANGSKSWILRYQIAGRTRHYGIGPTHTVSLAEARSRAAVARLQILDGIDPVASRRERKAAALLEAARSITFEQAAEEHIAAIEKGWKSGKDGKLAKQWRAHMATYAYPHFGRLAVAAIDTGFVVRALTPIWSEKSETASRVRQRIEAVLDAARVKGYRTGENPARWAGHLQHIFAALPAPQHHAAIDYREVAGFLGDLRTREAMAARALEFLVLTATRLNETLGARWEEFDLDARVWVVPAVRVKNRAKEVREHRVPLSDRAIEIIRSMEAVKHGHFVFYSKVKPSQPMSGNAIHDLLERMKRTDITAHGMRSCFRTWAGDETSHPAAVAEASLAHVVKGVEGVYLRTTFFEKRRKLMDDWSRYCCDTAGAGENVIPMRGA